MGVVSYFLFSSGLINAMHERLLGGGSALRGRGEQCVWAKTLSGGFEMLNHGLVKVGKDL